eukprot:1344797-Heterocapsa_arctica.AAC.1
MRALSRSPLLPLLLLCIGGVAQDFVRAFAKPRPVIKPVITPETSSSTTTEPPAVAEEKVALEGNLVDEKPAASEDPAPAAEE